MAIMMHSRLQQLKSDIFLSTQFTKWVILSNLFAWPVAYYFMHKWMQRFAIRPGLSIWPFLFASVVVLAVALFTVSFQTIKPHGPTPWNC
jgi:putative ABC transport system permease protein